MENILVNVKGSLNRNGQIEQTEFFTLGSMHTQNEAKVLSYAGAGGQDDLTEITLFGDSVVMKKQESGADDAAIVVLRERQMYSSFYHTPFGVVDMEVYPTLVHVASKEDGGSIELEYITRIADTQTLSRFSLTYAAQS